MQDSLNLVVKFLVYALVQVLILNNIQLFGLVCPFLYVLFILTLPTSMSTAKTMLWAFAIGLVVDIFANTYGIHIFASVLIAFVRQYVMKFFVTHENLEKIEPSYRNFGSAFFFYASVLVGTHHLMVYALEAFSMSHVWAVLLKTLCSSLATLLLIAAVQLLKQRKQ